MRYRGRLIDPVSVWEKYVIFPNVRIEEIDTFSPKVQCPNPNHDTLKSHFQINLTQATCHCFAHCGISGSWEHAIATIEGLYEKFHVEDSPNERERKRRTDRAHREARKIILKSARPGSKFRGKPHVQKKSGTRGAITSVRREQLSYESFLPQTALEYLTARGISDASIAAWQLGWLSEEKRLVIPAKDELNKLKFLIKRGIFAKQTPKYLYTEGFPKSSLLFGACALDLETVRSEGLIVVEGSIDVIRLHQHGFRNTVGILGTGISVQQRAILSRLRPKKVLLFFDKDTAGVQNIEIAVPRLRKYPTYVVKYPKHRSDPAEMEKEEIYRQLDRAVPAFKFLQRHGLSVSHKRRKERVGNYT